MLTQADRERLLAERQHLDEERQKQKVTHDAIAARAGVGRTYVVHYFRGRRFPRHDVIEPATRALIRESMVGRARRQRTKAS